MFNGLEDRQLLIRGVWEKLHKLGIGFLFLNSLLLVCKLYERKVLGVHTCI